jgi:hypothetical protein
MISWLEVTQIPFEYTESYSSSESGENSEESVLDEAGGDFVFIGTFTTTHVTLTRFGQTNNLNSFSREYASYKTINQDGTTTSFSSGSTSFVSINQNGGSQEAGRFTNWFVTTLGTGSDTSTEISSSDYENTREERLTSSEFVTEETTQTATDGSSFTELTEIVITTQQTTQEINASVTTESESSYTFVTSTETSTTTINSTGGSATSTTWTTTTSEETATTIVASFDSATINATVVTALEQTTAGNAYNSIYEAAPDEVIYMASQPTPLLGWGGIGQTVSWTTRTTRFADQTTESVYARDSSQTESSSLTIPESTSSISWSRSSSQTEVKTVLPNPFRLPHSTFTLLINAGTTTESSASGSTAEEVIQYNVTTKAIEVTYLETITLQRYRSSLEFQTTSEIVKATTRSAAIDAAGDTYVEDGDNSGATMALGGNTTVNASSFSLGIHAPEVLSPFNFTARGVEWLVFGSRGAGFGESGFGLSYPYTGNVSNISIAVSRRGRAVIFPATNETYTANDTGLTWRPNTDETSQTQSAQISAAGEPELILLNARTGLLGGRLQENEFVVQGAPRGLYQNASGATTWLNGDETSFGGTSVSSSWLQPKYWMGAGGLELAVAPRNETAMPSFVDGFGVVGAADDSGF